MGSVDEVVSDDCPAGLLIADRFRVIKELGRGGMARVMHVLDIKSNQEFALKLLKPEVAQLGEAIERFRREAELLSSLNHPSIVRVQTFGTLEDGRLYLVMELLHGQTLGALIRQKVLSPEELLPIVTSVAAGLDRAHFAGIIHRDLKPDNIFLLDNFETGFDHVKILDFGISKVDGRDSLTQTGQVVGTPRYMAPEQLLGEKNIDGRVDVYAFGLILYEAIIGQPAFPFTSPGDLIVAILNGQISTLRTVRPDISQKIEAIILRAMSKVRDGRYQTAGELARAWAYALKDHVETQNHRPQVSTQLMGKIDENDIKAVSGTAYDPLALRPSTFREFEAPRVAGKSFETVQLAAFSVDDIANAKYLPKTSYVPSDASDVKKRAVIQNVVSIKPQVETQTETQEKSLDLVSVISETNEYEYTLPQRKFPWKIILLTFVSLSILIIGAYGFFLLLHRFRSHELIESKPSQIITQTIQVPSVRKL